MLSDIEIAQGCQMRPITELAVFLVLHLPVWMPMIWSCTASTRQSCPQTCGPR